MKVILKLLYNGLIGAVALILINTVGNLISFHIAINVFSAFIVGLLGIPGLILLIILKPVLGL